RDPSRGLRPPVGTKVRTERLLILGLRSNGFHARDLDPPQDYAGIQVFLGGTAPPKATDGTELKIGDVVSVSGSLDVFSNQDEIDKIPSLVSTQRGVPVEPLDVLTTDLIGGAAGPAERLESLLIRVRNVTMRRLVATMGDDDFYITGNPAETCDAMVPPCAR